MLLIRPWFALILTPCGFVLSAWLARALLSRQPGLGHSPGHRRAPRRTIGARSRAAVAEADVRQDRAHLVRAWPAAPPSAAKAPPCRWARRSCCMRPSWAAWARTRADPGGLGGGRGGGLQHAAGRHRLRHRGNGPRLRAAHQRPGADRGDPGRPRRLGLVGNYNYFGSSASMLIVTIDWVAVLVCGVAGGLLGGCFAAPWCWRHRAAAAPGRRRADAARLLCGVACGLIVAAVRPSQPRRRPMAPAMRPRAARWKATPWPGASRR